jgi:hypothetical protein
MDAVYYDDVIVQDGPPLVTVGGAPNDEQTSRPAAHRKMLDYKTRPQFANFLELIFDKSAPDHFVCI